MIVWKNMSSESYLWSIIHQDFLLSFLSFPINDSFNLREWYVGSTSQLTFTDLTLRRWMWYAIAMWQDCRLNSFKSGPCCDLFFSLFSTNLKLEAGFCSSKARDRPSLIIDSEVQPFRIGNPPRMVSTIALWQGSTFLSNCICCSTRALFIRMLASRELVEAAVMFSMSPFASNFLVSSLEADTSPALNFFSVGLMLVSFLASISLLANAF